MTMKITFDREDRRMARLLPLSDFKCPDCRGGSPAFWRVTAGRRAGWLRIEFNLSHPHLNWHFLAGKVTTFVLRRRN
jgi:hypothetical protein